MSRVYLAENIRLNTLWCIKEIDKRTNHNIDLLAEPNLLKKLNHPSLPKVFDIIEEGDFLYIISDYIEGEPLDKLLESRGAIREDTAVDWACQLCGVLDYLHGLKPNPIIYRDMKPSNIILSGEGKLRLIDFGIAREYKREAGNDTVYIGTRGYAAPEQYGMGQTDPTTDIYSLGITLHHLVTGKSPNEPPFELKPVRAYNSGISAGLEFIIEKCTRPAGRDRYQTAAELQEDLGRLKAAAAGEDGTTGEGRGAAAGGKAAHGGAGALKRLVLAVWDNAEFGCELAYICAKLSGLKVMLIDLDLLAPKADLILNLKKHPDRVISEGRFNDSGLNIILDCLGKKAFAPSMLEDAAVKRGDLKNLFVLTGNYRLENYEYYSNESLLALIDKSYQSFDITILLLNRSIYDSFTVLALMKSDYNIIPCRADPISLREFNSCLVFLKEKQKIPLDKSKFVAYEYNPAYSLSTRIISEITGGNYIGSIGYSLRRIRYRNLRIPYARRMEKNIVRDYKTMLERWNILPKPTIIERLRGVYELCRS